MQTQTLNIALPKELLQKVDIVAKREYKNRSELIRTALFAYLKDEENWNQIFKAGGKTMKEMDIKSEEEVNKIVYEFRHKQKSR